MCKIHIYQDRAGEYRWRLKAENGETVATSEGYSSKEAAMHSAKMLPVWASSATIVEDDPIQEIFKRLLRK